MSSSEELEPMFMAEEEEVVEEESIPLPKRLLFGSSCLTESGNTAGEAVDAVVVVVDVSSIGSLAEDDITGGVRVGVEGVQANGGGKARLRVMLLLLTTTTTTIAPSEQEVSSVAIEEPPVEVVVPVGP
ncbi:hypothetical protein TYRP_004131 [Tyrophagus putrescentiae]|nr:hypothetical protein TYRP_004131 [Tyrophagus putrescentiae]